jgi:hypothetical protein
VALDQYLKSDGKLGFVITQSVFKTAGAGQGFRGFRLGDGTPLNVVHVDDMSEIKPFPGVGNRTAVMVLQKNQAVRYPVPYTLWRGQRRGRGRIRTIPDDLTLEEAGAMTERSHFVAQPVDKTDATSSWVSGRERALNAIGKVLGASEYRARAGVCTWLNGVYWLEIMGQRPDGAMVVSNLTKGTKRKLENVQATIEPDLVHPLLRGRDIRCWQATPSAHIIVTHEPGMKLKAIPEDEMAARLPKTYSYLKRFEVELRSRSGYRRYFRETDPFYSMFNVGAYTFASYKVVWPWISTDIVAAVVQTFDGKPVIPDNNVTLIATECADEAYYLAAVMNSAALRFTIRSFYAGGGGGIGRPAALTRAHVPVYDASGPSHCRLTALSQEAHVATAAGDAARVQEIEAEINRLAAELWGLSRQELEEIQRSLEELM